MQAIKQSAPGYFSGYQTNELKALQTTTVNNQLLDTMQATMYSATGYHAGNNVFSYCVPCRQQCIQLLGTMQATMYSATGYHAGNNVFIYWVPCRQPCNQLLKIMQPIKQSATGYHAGNNVSIKLLGTMQATMQSAAENHADNQTISYWIPCRQQCKY